MTAPVLERTLSDPTILKPPVMSRKKSLFNLRKEPSTPQLERKHTFRKRSNTRPSDDLLLIELRHQIRGILGHGQLKSKEKALIEQILEVTNTPDNLLILLRQFIKDPALRELLAPKTAFKKLQGIPEILILPSPDIKGFPLYECARLFEFDDALPLQISVNGTPIEFVSGQPELALHHFLSYVKNAGWEIHDEDKERLVSDILQEKSTRLTKLLQATCIHAPGDAYTLFLLSLVKLDFSRGRSFPIECFIHSDQRFCVIHRIQYKIEGKTELLLSATNTYDHGEWTSALYLTNIKGEPLKAIDELKKLRGNQQEPAGVDHLFTRHDPTIRFLSLTLKRLESIIDFQETILKLSSLEELYVVNETCVRNRAMHQSIQNEVSKEHVRALSTYTEAVHHIADHEKGMMAALRTHLFSDRMYLPLERHLLEPLKKEYTIEEPSDYKHVWVYRLHEDHLTLLVIKRLSFLRKGEVAWSCNRFGAVTYWRGRTHAHILLTDISPFEHHHEKKHLEAYFKNYEKACLPAFYKKSS